MYIGERESGGSGGPHTQPTQSRGRERAAQQQPSSSSQTETIRQKREGRTPPALSRPAIVALSRPSSLPPSPPCLLACVAQETEWAPHSPSFPNGTEKRERALGWSVTASLSLSFFFSLSRSPPPALDVGVAGGWVGGWQQRLVSFPSSFSSYAIRLCKGTVVGSYTNSCVCVTFCARRQTSILDPPSLPLPSLYIFCM